MKAPTIGALFAGYGGLDLAVHEVLGAQLAWVSEIDPGPSRILAQRYPGVPNLGDVTAVDWAAVELVDIITGGSPCQDLSHAGKRAGMRAGRAIPAGVMACGCRWAEHEADSCDAASPAGDVPSRLHERQEHVAAMRAIAALNTRDRADGGPPPERREAGTRSGLWASMCDAIETIRPRLVVWENVRGALSAEADSAVEPCPICVGDGGRVSLRALGRVLGDLAELGYDAAWTSLRAADIGAPHGRFRVFVLAWPQGDTAPVPTRLDQHPAPARPAGRGRGDLGVSLLKTPTSSLGVNGGAQHPARRRAGGHGPTLADEIEHLLPTPKTTDAKGHSPGDLRRAEPGLRALPSLLPTPRATDGTKGGPNQRGSSGDLMLPSAVLLPTFGQYAPAIARWETVLGRPAPAPTEPTGRDGAHRLAPRFVEWMMGLPDGWVTGVGLSRNEQLKALGNGVVPQQAAAAIRHLLTVRAAALAGQEVAS